MVLNTENYITRTSCLAVTANYGRKHILRAYITFVPENIGDKYMTETLTNNAETQCTLAA